MYEMSEVDKASGLKNQRLVLVNRPSVGKSNSVQMLESLISSKEQAALWLEDKNGQNGCGKHVRRVDHEAVRNQTVSECNSMYCITRFILELSFHFCKNGCQLGGWPMAHV